MANDVSFMQYMRAHGNTAGPTQRPFLVGAITGAIGFVPFEVVLRLSGARAAIASGLGISTTMSAVIGIGIMLVAGILYAAIFKRAANDREGGWLFGASFGFLVWLIAPITLWQLVTSRQIAVGSAAMGLFGAHVLYGLVLGTAFPWIHSLVQSRLDNNNRLNGEFKDEKGESDEQGLF